MSLWDSAIFQVYTALTFFAAIMYGAALVLTRILPRWLGWVIIVYSLVGIIAFVILNDMPPFVHYLLPIVIGVLLLLPRYQLPAPSSERLDHPASRLQKEGVSS